MGEGGDKWMEERSGGRREVDGGGRGRGEK